MLPDVQAPLGIRAVHTFDAVSQRFDNNSSIFGDEILLQRSRSLVEYCDCYLSVLSILSKDEDHSHPRHEKGMTEKSTD